MTTKRKILLAGALLAAPGYVALTQITQTLPSIAIQPGYTFDTNTLQIVKQPTFQRDSAANSQPTSFRIDHATGRLFSENGDEASVSKLNTPETMEARRQAFAEMINPATERPLSAEEQQAEDRAIWAIMHPKEAAENQ